MARTDKILVLYGKAARIATSFVAVELTKDATNEPLSKGVPAEIILDNIEVCWDTSATTPATMTWFLSWDSDGNIPLTPQVDTTITTGADLSAGGLAPGGIVANIQAGKLAIADQETDGSIYLIAKLDAGTIGDNSTATSVRARLFIRA